MRVLLLTHPEADFGEYFLYNGLCELLGDENVVDVPLKLSYHGEVHVYPGYEQYEVHSNWGLCGTGNRGTTAPFAFARARRGHAYSEADIRDMLRSGAFELVVVGSSRVESRRYLRILGNELRGKKIVVCDNEDFFDIYHPDIWQDQSLDGIKLYLKRELTREWQNKSWPFTVRPFPFSCAIDSTATADGTIDVLCAVGDTNPVRAIARSAVSSLPNANVICGYWSWSRYVELMHQSKIVIAPRGFGQDTARRWEIPGCGVLLLCERLDLVEDNPLQDGIHCAYYSTPEELTNKIRHYLAHDDQRLTIAAAGRAFVREHHSNRARSRSMLEMVREVYG